MYTKHYPQPFCMTSIYSHGEYNIWYIINLVMRDNMRRMGVWQAGCPFASLKHQEFF